MLNCSQLICKSLHCETPNFLGNDVSMKLTFSFLYFSHLAPEDPFLVCSFFRKFWRTLSNSLIFFLVSSPIRDDMEAKNCISEKKGESADNYLNWTRHVDFRSANCLQQGCSLAATEKVWTLRDLVICCQCMRGSQFLSCLRD